MCAYGVCVCVCVCVCVRVCAWVNVCVHPDMCLYVTYKHKHFKLNKLFDTYQIHLLSGSHDYTLLLLVVIPFR